MGEFRHDGSLRVAENPPEGPETGANQPVSGKLGFPLDVRSDFWEPRACHSLRFSASCRTARPATGGLFCFMGFDFLPERLRCGANQFAPRASLWENLVPFKRADTTPCGFGARCRLSRCRKNSRSRRGESVPNQPGLKENSGADATSRPGFSRRRRPLAQCPCRENRRHAREKAEDRGSHRPGPATAAKPRSQRPSFGGFITGEADFFEIARAALAVLANPVGDRVSHAVGKRKRLPCLLLAGYGIVVVARLAQKHACDMIPAEMIEEPDALLRKGKRDLAHSLGRRLKSGGLDIADRLGRDAGCGAEISPRPVKKRPRGA